jgi:hypothetical protein
MNKIAKSIGIIKDELENDKGLRIAYIANVAMLLHDKYGVTDFKERNNAAIDILNLLFDTKFDDKTFGEI